jgi:hypothetical protein
MVEIGKRDIWSRQAVQMERQDVTYKLLAVDFLPQNVNAKYLAQTAKFLASGKISPLPQNSYGMSSIISALKGLASARHVGKVVVKSELKSLSEGKRSMVLLGGLGSLGLFISTCMQSDMFEPLILTGRSGKVSSQDGNSRFEQLGNGLSTVVCCKMDMGSKDGTQSFRDASFFY